MDPQQEWTGRETESSGGGKGAKPGLDPLWEGTADTTLPKGVKPGLDLSWDSTESKTRPGGAGKKPGVDSCGNGMGSECGFGGVGGRGGGNRARILGGKRWNGSAAGMEWMG